MPVCFGDPVVGLRRRNRLAVGCPPCVCQHVLAFSSNFFGSITHRGGRDALLYHTSHKRIRVFVLERNNTGGVEFSVLNFTAPVQ
ncbi:MAG: hypothetical protein LBQ66_15185, partial [Planctomycetaceae bacterium]|nr:hypothetical protein [Planctomycetaceae bacterium]